MTNINTIATRFEQSRPTTFSALCPVCRKDSLKIFEAEQSIGIRCLDRCPRYLILERIGLTARDLQTPPLPPLTPDSARMDATSEVSDGN